MTKVQKRAYKLMGACLLSEGQPQSALFAFRAACNRRGILACAKKCLEEELLFPALEGFKAVGKTPSKRTLVRLGKRHFRNGEIEAGIAYFKAAGLQPSTVVLIACADIAFSQGRLRDGCLAMKVAKAKPTANQLVSCAKKCFREGWLQDGLEALSHCKISPSARQLIMCGRRALERGFLQEGLNALELAEKQALTASELLAVGKCYLGIGYHDGALHAFERMHEL